MRLKYQPAFENPLALGITLFLGLCSTFALAVAILNFGRYGYIPEWSFFWSLYALIIHWNIKVHLEKIGDVWQYDVKFFNKSLITRTFDKLTIKEDGKYNHVVGENKGDRKSTWITGDAEYRSTTLGFIQ